MRNKSLSVDQDQACIPAECLLQDLELPQELVKLRGLAVGLGGQLDHLCIGDATNLRGLLLHFAFDLIEFLLGLTLDLVLLLHGLRIVQPRDPQSL